MLTLLEGKLAKTSDSDPADSDPRGSLRAERIPSSQYTSQFLEGLRARGEVLAVPEDWDGASAAVPPHVTWVIYPNGDLERVGFN